MSLVTVHGPARRVLSGDRLSAPDLAAIEADLRQWSKPKITWQAGDPGRGPAWPAVQPAGAGVTPGDLPG